MGNSQLAKTIDHYLKDCSTQYNMSAELTASTATCSLPSSEELSYQHTTTLQDLFSGTLAPKTAALKLSALTIPNPKIRRHKYAYQIQLLFENILSPLHKQPHQVQLVADLIICISDLPPIWAQPSPEAPKHFISDENTCLWDDEGAEFGRVLGGEWDRELIEISPSNNRQRANFVSFLLRYRSSHPGRRHSKTTNSDRGLRSSERTPRDSNHAQREAVRVPPLCAVDF
jgi:hypothetical protein